MYSIYEPRFFNNGFLDHFISLVHNYHSLKRHQSNQVVLSIHMRQEVQHALVLSEGTSTPIKSQVILKIETQRGSHANGQALQ